MDVFMMPGLQKALQCQIRRRTGLQNGKQAESPNPRRSSFQCSPTSQVVHHRTHAHHRESHHSASRRSSSDSHVLLQYSVRLVDVHHQSSMQHNMQQKCRMFSERYTVLQFCLFPLHFLLVCIFLHFFPSIYYLIFIYIYLNYWVMSCIFLQLDFMPTKKVSVTNPRKLLNFISHYRCSVECFFPFKRTTLIAVLTSCSHLTSPAISVSHVSFNLAYLW